MDRSALPQSPFMPANGAMSSMTVNPIELLAAMKQLAPRNVLPEPRYATGYKKPPKPEPEKVRERANMLFQEAAVWRELIEVTVSWIRHERVGMFPEDIEDRKNGLQEEFISTALTTKRNGAISRVAGAKQGIRKTYYDDNLRRKTQQIEDAAAWLMLEFERQWSIKGQRDLAIDEALLLIDRGIYCSRQVFDPYDDYCPINIDLIEPTQVHPVWGGKRGLQQVYRVYRDTMSGILADYGDFTEAQRKKITDKYGNDPSDVTELPVYEYWDSWHRMILVDNVPIINTEHKYGYVPWTIQPGGFGDAMFTRTPGEGAQKGFGQSFVQIERSRLNERKYKAVPLIYYDTRSHEIFEAVMGRLLTGFKREINPPIERHRSTLLAGTDMPEYSQAPGAVNEVAMGEEEIRVSPQLQNSPVTGMMVQALAGERAQRDISINEKAGQSNVTGAALDRYTDAGQEILLPVYRSLQRAKEHQIEQLLTTIGNWQHLSKYGVGKTRPVIVPAKKRAGDYPPSFELTRELIDEVGPRVEVRYKTVNTQDWINIFNAGKIGIEIGVVTPEEVREEATGDTDYDTFFEKWMQQKTTMSAISHPKYNELFLIPGMLAEQIKESAGDEEMVQFWSQRLQEWMELAKQQAQPQPGMEGPPQGGPPAPGNMGAPSGAPIQNPFPAPPVSGGGGTMPSIVGPGSQGAPVGRPPMR